MAMVLGLNGWQNYGRGPAGTALVLRTEPLRVSSLRASILSQANAFSDLSITKFYHAEGNTL